MRIFDETKTTEIFYPDLNVGKLVADKLFVAHHPRVYAQGETYRWKIVDGEYVKDIISPEIEGREAYDEYEEIQVYVPLTAEEMQERHIEEIKERLSQLSEDFVQSWAGAYIPDLDERKTEFAELHNELRVLLGKTPRSYY